MSLGVICLLLITVFAIAGMAIIWRVSSKEEQELMAENLRRSKDPDYEAVHSIEPMFGGWGAHRLRTRFVKKLKKTP